MFRWIGAQGQVKLVKNTKTGPHCYVTNRKAQTQIEKIFLQSKLEHLPNP